MPVIDSRVDTDYYKRAKKAIKLLDAGRKKKGNKFSRGVGG